MPVSKGVKKRAGGGGRKAANAERQRDCGLLVRLLITFSKMGGKTAFLAQKRGKRAEF